MSEQNETRQSFLVFFQKKLPPNGQEVKVSVAGQFFNCAEVTGGTGEPFEMRFDSHPYFQMNLGLGFRLPPPDRFKELFFRNPTAKEMTVSFYAGSAHVEDSRLNIVRGRAAPFMHAASVITGHSGTVAGLGTVDLTGDHPTNSKYLRKATIVCNMDPAVDLELLDEDDEVIATVLFRTAFQVESSAGIKIKNNSAGAVIFRASQIWYVIEV